MEKGIMQQVNQDENLSHFDVVLPENVEDDDGIDEILIEDVRNNGILWNTSLRDYKDIAKKSQAWGEITSRLNRNSKFCWLIMLIVSLGLYYRLLRLLLYLK